MANGYWKKWYKKNREKFNALVNKHKRRQRRKIKKLIDERKNNPCIICSKTFAPEAMDFCHRDDKEKKFRISDAGKKIYSLKKLEAELDKCDLYCAICRVIINREKFLSEQPSGAKGDRRKKLRELIDSLKGTKCSECGEVYPSYVIEWDHLGEVPKEGTISHMINDGANEENILKEIKKTEPVCIICHRIRTNKRNQYGKKNED